MGGIDRPGGAVEAAASQPAGASISSASAPATAPDRSRPGAASAALERHAATEDSSWPGRLTPAPPDGIGPSADSSSPFPSVGFTISTAGYAIARRFRAMLAPLELEPREFGLLRAVGAAEGQSQQAIGDRLQIRASRMVAFVDALEARGLLERRQNPEDRRARALHLTDDGRHLLERAFALAVESERDLCRDLSDEEREQLLDLLQRVAVRLGLPRDVRSAQGHAALADE